jgi:hypothetical protein
MLSCNRRINSSTLLLEPQCEIKLKDFCIHTNFIFTQEYGKTSIQYLYMLVYMC